MTHLRPDNYAGERPCASRWLIAFLLVLPLTVLLAASVATSPAGAQRRAVIQYGGDPLITVDDDVVNPGQEITVTVTGCGPPGAEVDVLFEGEVIATVVIGTAGSFVVTVTVPEGAELGPATIEVECDDEPVTTVVTVVDDAEPTPTSTPPDDGGDDGADGGVGADGDDSLPTTGGRHTRLWVQLGVGLVGGGLLVLYAGRRYRDHQMGFVDEGGRHDG